MEASERRQACMDADARLMSLCSSRATGRMFSVTQVASNGGAACAHAEGEWMACTPGQGYCPVDIDCDGSWSDCNADCERVFTQRVARSGDGGVCPPAPLCRPGDDACPFSAEVGEKCSQLKCPNGYRARALASEDKCAAAVCTYGADLEACCENVGLFTRVEDATCACHGCQAVDTEGQWDGKGSAGRGGMAEGGERAYSQVMG